MQALESKYRKDAAESWDNVGLLVGDAEKEVKKVFLALDVTDETLEAAVSYGADMMITHHPLIFSGMKKVTEDDFIGRRVRKLIRHDISYYAMHTNFDILGMADLSADYLELKNQEVLEITKEQDGQAEGLGRIGELSREMKLGDFVRFVKEKFVLPHVRFWGNENTLVKRAAVCTGSGKSLLREVLNKQADVYVTGDIDYHTGIDALAQGVSIVDAGHYGTEYIFIAYMKQELKKQFPELLVEGMEISFPDQVI